MSVRDFINHYGVFVLMAFCLLVVIKGLYDLRIAKQVAEAQERERYLIEKARERREAVIKGQTQLLHKLAGETPEPSKTKKRSSSTASRNRSTTDTNTNTTTDNTVLYVGAGMMSSGSDCSSSSSDSGSSFSCGSD